jgi:hypothetical protein
VPADNQEDIDRIAEAATNLRLDKNFDPEVTNTMIHINSDRKLLVATRISLSREAERTTSALTLVCCRYMAPTHDNRKFLSQDR